MLDSLCISATLHFLESFSRECVLSKHTHTDWAQNLRLLILAFSDVAIEIWEQLQNTTALSPKWLSGSLGERNVFDRTTPL